MPHIIVEFSETMEDILDVSSLLHKLHRGLAVEGVDQSRIKTRAIELEHFVIGNNEPEQGSMIHITLLLLEGRGYDVKNQYGQALHAIAKEYVAAQFPDCVITLEVRDMVKETYIL